MPVLTIYTQDTCRQLNFAPGLSLRDILNSSDLQVRSACRGVGACGLCKVRIDRHPEAFTLAELFHLDAAERAADVRLACQIKPLADVSITLLNQASHTPWKTLPDACYTCAFPLPAVEKRAGKTGYGMAVDLGTTNISVALYNLETGIQLIMRVGPNPQGRYGADIINRLMSAAESEEQATYFQQLALFAIGDALQDIAGREGFPLAAIRKAAVVGNSAMCCLLNGCQAQLLLQPYYWTRPLACTPPDRVPWPTAWNLQPDIQMEILPPLAGFVGADLLAGLVHTRLTAGDKPVLFIDFGTNSEIALWDGSRLWVTSTAGGPAFEGTGLACGMCAEPGAVYRVHKTEPANWQADIISQLEIKGLCGSGLVDILALLRDSGELQSNGRFRQPVKKYPLPLADADLFITKHDVDMLQRAKAAIGVGVVILCREAGIHYEDIDKILVGGAFGRYLDPVNAVHIGLLPPLAPERIHLCGNTALHGCADMILSPQARDLFDTLKNQAKLINLSTVSTFEELFLEHLYLQPMERV